MSRCLKSTSKQSSDLSGSPGDDDFHRNLPYRLNDETSADEAKPNLALFRVPKGRG